MLDQCINDVYKRDKKVFIPDFGAVIYSEFNDGVDFNGLLDFDDGKVVAEIRKQQFLSEEDARKALVVYIKDIKNTLDRGKSVFFGGIGYLSKDTQGTISIQKAKPSYRSKKRAKSSDDDLSLENERAELPVNDYSLNDNKVIVTEPVEEEPLNIESFDQDEYSETQESTGSEISNDVWDESDDDNLLSSDDEYSFPFDHENEKDRPGKRKTLATAIFVLIPIALIVAGGFYFFNRDAVEGSENNQDSYTVLASMPATENPEAADVLENSATGDNSGSDTTNESVVTASVDPAPVSVPQSTSGLAADAEKNYCLILGSFKIERNADDYQMHLRSRGIEAIKFQGRYNFYYVGYKEIRGKSMAVKQLMEIKDENPSAWIIDKELLTL